MKRLLLATAVFGLLTAAGPAAWARKWTSSDGRFSVEAELVDFADGQVTLKKPGGETVSVPLSRLSVADRQFVVAATKTPKPPAKGTPRGGKDAASRTQNAPAEPCTKYKARDIQNARENLKRYRWAKDVVESWKSDVEVALSQDRQWLEAMFPDLTPGCSYGQSCPACLGKQSIPGEMPLRWRTDAPEELKCKYCGTTYPNPRYPETGKLVCPRMGQTFTYYETEAERANPQQRAKYALRWNNQPRETSFSSTIRHNKVIWATSQLLPLAKLYALTGEVRYAERAAWLLNRMAVVFPNYLYHSYDGSIADCPPAEAAANMGTHGSGGRFPKEVIVHAYGLNRRGDYAFLGNGFVGAGRLSPHGSGSDGPPLLAATVAYDLIRHACYPDGRRVMDEPMDRRIVNDLILAGAADMDHYKEIHNMAAPSRAVSAAVGVLFRQPERVRRGLEGFRLLLEDLYHFDGFCRESPAYSAQHLRLMANIPVILDGYSDPPGYRPAKGERLERFDPFSAVPRYRLALESTVRMLAPGNRLPPIGDTRADALLEFDTVETLACRHRERYARLLEAVQGAPLEKKGSESALWYRPADLRSRETGSLPLRSEWFPGWHLAVLRGGRPQGDTAFFFNATERNWTGITRHRQADTLSVSFYAHGVELASDRGYVSGTGHPGQRWVASTLAHNLVAVDGKNQSIRECGAALELFGTAQGVEVVQASGVDLYPQCTEYRRTCALVSLPAEQTYAVDFFRVQGGRLHQYAFNCNGRLVQVSGPDPQPADDKIEWLSNLRAVKPTDTLTCTWEHKGVKLDLVLLSIKDTVERFLIADAPGWRQATGPEMKKPPIQQILAENRAHAPAEGAASQYAVLMVPYRSDRSPILSARLLENDYASGAMAVEVKLQGRTDYLISTRDQTPRTYGPVTAGAQFAFVSLDAQGQVAGSCLLGGTSLKCGALRLTFPRPNTPLKVRSVEERTFHLAEPLPAGLGQPGTYLLAETTGYEIESTTRTSITVRDYPAIPSERVVVGNP